MKKITAILLLSFFLIANSGVAVSAHWCGGKLASINLYANGEHKCKCGKKAMKPNCCKDKTVQLKANDELVKTTFINFKIPIQKFLLACTSLNEVIPSSHYQFAVVSFYHPPLFKPKVPIFLLDGVFLI